MRFLPVNIDALLVELETLEQVMALTDALQYKKDVWNINEIIPAARTVLVRYNSIIMDGNKLAQYIAQLDVSSGQLRSGELVTIPVSYNGEDL